MHTPDLQDLPDQGHRGDEPHLLREIIRTHQVILSRFSRAVGMPASRLALMRLLATADRPTGTLELARQLEVNAAAVTRQLKELEAEGLIERQADPRDARRCNIVLSEEGIRLFGEIHSRSHALERQLASVIAPEELAAAAATLARLRSFIENLR